MFDLCLWFLAGEWCMQRCMMVLLGLRTYIDRIYISCAVSITLCIDDIPRIWDNSLVAQGVEDCFVRVIKMILIHRIIWWHGVVVLSHDVFVDSNWLENESGSSYPHIYHLHGCRCRCHYYHYYLRILTVVLWLANVEVYCLAQYTKVVFRSLLLSWISSHTRVVHFDLWRLHGLFIVWLDAKISSSLSSVAIVLFLNDWSRLLIQFLIGLWLARNRIMGIGIDDDDGDDDNICLVLLHWWNHVYQRMWSWWIWWIVIVS